METRLTWSFFHRRRLSWHLAIQKFFYTRASRKSAYAELVLFRKGSGTVSLDRKCFRTLLETGAGLEREKIAHLLNHYASLVTGRERIQKLFLSNMHIRAHGGGVAARVKLLQLTLGRAMRWLCLHNINDAYPIRAYLRRFGASKLDVRIKERRKFSLKKARKAPQWHKR